LCWHASQLAQAEVLRLHVQHAMFCANSTYITARQMHWKVDKLTVEVLEQEALALLMLFSLAAGGPCCDQQC
jgi:hypothetical protein